MVKALRLFESNYSYLVIISNEVLIIDPGESSKILDVINKMDLKPIGILLTHNHSDHCGGVKEILQSYPTAVLIQNSIGEQSIGNFIFKTIYTPGHTSDSYSFYFKDENAVFTGDTLFIGLCGKVFDGSIKELHRSLQLLTKLPKNTKVYPGHEYLHYSLDFMKTTGVNSEFYNSIKDKENPSLLSDIESEIINNQFMTKDYNKFKFLRELKG